MPMREIEPILRRYHTKVALMASSETSTTPLEPMAGGRVEGEGWLGEKWWLGA